ncbi:MAG: Chromosomal replication initiator protein dnaA, partial [Pseudomonadota bacterium]
MGLPLERAPEPAWQDIWSAVQERVRLECGQGVYDTWIAPLTLGEAADGQVRLTAPGRLVRDYVALHHAARIERAFAALA